MLPSFDSERRRPINLGGSTSQSQASILDQARLRRIEREAFRRKQDSATVIQAWWRGLIEKQRVQRWLRSAMDNASGVGADGITQMRSLVLIGHDQQVLGEWSASMGGSLFDHAQSPNREHWLVLIRQISFLLLQSVANRPQSQYAIPQLRILTSLLNPASLVSALGPAGNDISSNITLYLIKRQLYEHISRAIRSIPSEAKSDHALPYLVQLVYLPLSIVSSPPLSKPTSIPAETSSDLSKQALLALVTQILTIPLLPNRIPLPSLSALSAQLPFDAFGALESCVEEVPRLVYGAPGIPGTSDENAAALTMAESCIHLVANLLAFVPPRYPSLHAPALRTYLRLLAALLGALPIGAPEPPLANSSMNQRSVITSASDSDDASTSEHLGISVSIVSSFASKKKPRSLPTLDARTKKRLLVLPSVTHLGALLDAAHRVSSSTSVNASLSSPSNRYLFSPIHALTQTLLALTAVWPGRREKVLNALLAYRGGGLVREIWRDWIRSAAPSLSGGGMSVFDPAHASIWPPLLLLTDLYSHSLRTMGDDEFFSSSNATSTMPSSSMSRSNAASSAGVARTSLTIDELLSFSRMLFNVAFTLYWKDGTGVGGIGAGGGRSSISDISGGRANQFRDDDMQVNEGSTHSSSRIGEGNARVNTLDGEVPGIAGMQWETAREKITTCLQGIVARDARKPFMPPDHWQVSTHIDMNSFVEAAIYEDLQLSPSPSSPMPAATPSHPHRRNRPLTKQQLAHLSPRLGILNNIPFAIPFETRVAIFRRFVDADLEHRGMSMQIFSRRHRLEVEIRRNNIAQDGYDKLADADLHAPISISFIDQFGEPEAGIDGGGVFKEFFTSLCKEVFDSDRGLWLANTRNELYPNPHSYATEPHSLNWYRFIGRILGKALYEGILVDVAFAGFFLAKWLGKQSFLDDLASLDPELYQGLIFLKNYTGNMEDLSLNFTVATEEFGVAKALNLIPNGNNVAVTRENRLQYIYLVSHYRLSKQIKLQSEAFFEGLSDMIDPKWLRMFNQQELQILLGGVNAPIDLEDLRQHTNYGGLYDNDEPTIQAFWKVMSTFDQEQRRAFLRFVTSCSRPPLLGFKQLIPNFAIRDAGSDEHRLPTSSTCVNLLKLPRYKSAQVLHDKLLQAISSGAGFDLS
ncbi:HECT-domain-containing protein [Hygrophoropsis aurantiaca]|uniref:HECT-domain-containing protein n=1 Tax=Hygrophoropsis aurantiaca TaxID=72124 RepID=A0ACB8A0F5_9AGAM|nr:HECT-domain-containing protein [Hygrophoropsis aurantiaca]